MTTHIFYLKLQLLLCSLLRSLSPSISIRPYSIAVMMCPYLESKVLQEVCCSVGPVGLRAASGIDPDADGRRLSPWRVLGSDLRKGVNCSPHSCQKVRHTVKPLVRVVDSVLEPWETGVARPLVKGELLLLLTALMAARERRAVCRFNASRREAIAFARGAVGSGGDGRRRVRRMSYLEL